MESAQCYLGLGLILGMMSAGLFGVGEHWRQAAMRKIRAYPKERTKARETEQKAAGERRKGWQALPVAYLFMLVGAALCLFALYLLANT